MYCNKVKLKLYWWHLELGLVRCLLLDMFDALRAVHLWAYDTPRKVYECEAPYG
jgi:hypothetical protein